MSCVHTETTTLLWLYGELEGDTDAHALHVAGCGDCSAAVKLHSDVVAVVAPVLPSVSGARPVHAANNTRWFALVAMAAGLMFVVSTALPRSAPETIPQTPAPALVATSGPVLGARASIDEFDPDFRDLDQRLDALEADLDLL